MEADLIQNTLEPIPIKNYSKSIEVAEGIKEETEEEELQRLPKPHLDDLPLEPPSSVEFSFARYYALGMLCVIGLAPTHIAFRDDGGGEEVDFNVGKSDRSSMKVTGKRKRADRDGYIAIIMPKPADWLKIRSSSISHDDYTKLRFMNTHAGRLSPSNRLPLTPDMLKPAQSAYLSVSGIAETKRLRYNKLFTIKGMESIQCPSL